MANSVCSQCAAFPHGIPASGRPARPSLTCRRPRNFSGLCPQLHAGKWHSLDQSPTQCGAGFSGNVNGLDSSLAVPLHWMVGTTQQWNFTIQRRTRARLVRGTRLRGHQRHPLALDLRSRSGHTGYAAESGHHPVRRAIGRSWLACTIVDSTCGKRRRARAISRHRASGLFEDFCA